MIRVADELGGSQLNYWVARAEGVPAEELRIVYAQPALRKGGYVVRQWINSEGYPIQLVLAYSKKWIQCGPLIRKYQVELTREAEGVRRVAWIGETYAYGDTEMQAICRAVVRAKFGDEIEKVIP